jgi:hypothetical protein
MAGVYPTSTPNTSSSSIFFKKATVASFLPYLLALSMICISWHWQHVGALARIAWHRAVGQ